MHRRLTALASWAFVVGLVLALALAAGAQTPPGVDRIASNGFNDHHNSYSWSTAWFKGKLYVGTARDAICVEAITYDFFYPGSYKAPPDGFPEADCPPDKYDVDLRAEIWQFTPETESWKRVYQSPADIPNPRAPGKFVARDIGFRGMVVHHDANGEDALYVGGVTADEYIPELAEAHPPRILRSVDGETFTPLPGGPGIIHNAFGAQRPIGFRAMVSHGGRLYVTASGGLTGDGVILEVKNPSGANPQFVQVSPDTVQVFELEVFNGSLYAGVGDAEEGYSVWKVDTTRRNPPLRFKPIVTGGAGRGSAITSVVSMHVYEGRLYVGASGWGAIGVFPSTELIRVNSDDSWELVVGNGRFADGTLKYPISGLQDGFGNIFNGHFWRAETHEGGLYVGTNDWSWALRNIPPFGQWFAPEFGFDLYGSCDGQFWFKVTGDGFGDGHFNFGARTLVSTPVGEFLGTTNHIEGTSVWRSQDASPCGAGAFAFRTVSDTAAGAAAQTTQAATPATLPSPGRLLAEAQPCGTVLSWDRRRSASRYRIRRSSYRPLDIDVTVPPTLPGGFVPEDVTPTVASPGSAGTRRGRVWVPGPSIWIGTTAKGYFVDRRAKAGARYTYEVVAEGASSRASQPSNLATPLSEATFDRLSASIHRVRDGRKACR